MKIGLNLWVWESPFRTDRDLGLIERAKSLGAEAVEIALEEGGLVDGRALKRALGSSGVGCSAIGMFGSERDLASSDPATRQKGLEYAKRCFDTCAAAGIAVLSGACVGAGGSEWLSNGQRLERYKYAAECLQKIGAMAAKAKVPFCVEVLNRYEDSLLNTSAQGLELMAMTAHPSVGFHLDTFHMSMEEDSLGDAIRLAGKHLFHLHASESQRGIPGRGNVKWAEVAKALRDIKYRGFATIESFNPQGRLAPMARAWHPYAESQDRIAKDGLAFLLKALRT